MDLVDVLATLVSKNFGDVKVARSRDIRFVVGTFRDAYEIEEAAAKKTRGSFRSEMRDGRIHVLVDDDFQDRVGNLDYSRADGAVWIEE